MRCIGRPFALLVTSLLAGCGSGTSRPTSNATACIATSAATLVDCADAVQSGASAEIEVQGAIVCTGADACRVRIADVPVTIRGVAGASIRRIDHHDYPLLQFVGNASVTIESLTIDENSDVACTPVSTTNPPVENPACGRSIDVYGVTDIALDHVTVAASKSVGAMLSESGNATVRHARFVGARLFGLEVTGLSGGLVVEDTVFSGIDSNAMVLYDVHGTASTPLRISRALFEQNHRHGLFFMCGPQANEVCPGGQLYLAGAVDFLRVEDTAIRLGSSDTGPVGGVEVNSTGVRDITFVRNDVHAHGMWGVYLNPNPVDVARVSFFDNKLYDNGTDPAYLGVDIGNFPAGVVSTEIGTCRSAGCASVPVGALWALPGGAISWATNDLHDPRVTVNGELVSTSADGQTTVAVGSVVVLSDGTTEVDRAIAP